MPLINKETTTPAPPPKKKKKASKRKKDKPVDMGIVNGVRLTYYKGSVFATPQVGKKRLKGLNIEN